MMVIADFDPTMDKSVKWMKLPQLSLVSPLTIRGPLLYIYLHFKNVDDKKYEMYRAEENEASPLHILCMLMPKINTTSCTHVSLDVV